MRGEEHDNRSKSRPSTEDEGPGDAVRDEDDESFVEDAGDEGVR